MNGSWWYYMYLITVFSFLSFPFAGALVAREEPAFWVLKIALGVWLKMAGATWACFLLFWLLVSLT